MGSLGAFFSKGETSAGVRFKLRSRKKTVAKTIKISLEFYANPTGSLVFTLFASLSSPLSYSASKPYSFVKPAMHEAAGNQACAIKIFRFAGR